MGKTYYKFPLVFLTGALVLGILIAPIAGLNSLVFLLFLPFFYFGRIVKGHSYISLLIMIGLGILCYHINWKHKQIGDIGEDHQITFCEVEVNGISTTAKKLKLSVEVIKSENDKLVDQQLYVYTDKSADFLVGDILLIDGELIKFQKPTIPDQFNFEDYYNKHGYMAQIFASEHELIKVDHHRSFNYYIERLRNHLRSNLDLLVKAPEERAVLKALVVGDRQELTSELKNVYVTAGIFHVLAVSGLHVGMMYFIIMFLIRMIPNKNLKMAIVIFSLLFYACLTGLSTSVIRAGVMFLFFGFATIYQKKTNSINVLFASCFLILIFKPNFLFESGFQLSISAVLGILLFFRKIENWFRFDNYILKKIWSFAAVSIAAQILTTPLILFYFHQFPTYFLIINVVAVLIIQFALIMGSIAAAIGGAYGFGSLLAKGSEYLCFAINKMAYYVSNLPYSRILGVHVDLQQVVCLMLGILCIYWLITYKKRLYFYTSCVMFFLFAWFSANRFIQYSNQDYLAFHKIKTNLVIEHVQGKTSTLYYQLDKLQQNEIQLTFLNYWSKRNISIYRFNPIKEGFSVDNDWFITNKKGDGDYQLKLKKWTFEVSKKEEVIFDSDSKQSLIMLN